MQFCFISFSITHMDWTGQHREFIEETFIKNESVTTTQKAFRLHLGLGRYIPVPTRNTILLWVTNFKTTGSALKGKSNEKNPFVKKLLPFYTKSSVELWTTFANVFVSV